MKIRQMAILTLSLALAPTALALDLGLREGYEAEVVISGLENPTTLAFHPTTNELVVAESAAGRILKVASGKAEPYAAGFETEYWKKTLVDGVESRFYHIGPLGLVFLSDGTLVVGTGGLPDGKEVVAFLASEGDASSARTSNPVGKEGNFVGLATSTDEKSVYVCSHGDDTKTWILKCGVATAKLETWLSLDEMGILTNSPLALVRSSPDRLLLLLSGGTTAGGGGAVIEIDEASAKPTGKSWTFPGLEDVYGFVSVPDSPGAFVVCDYNFDLKNVKPGKLALATLPEGGGEAAIELVADQMMGPVHLLFAPGTRDLFVAELGASFDSNEGRVLKITGF